MMSLHRRAVLAGAASLALVAPLRAAPTSMRVTKDPNCGCCGAWIEHMKANGFTAEIVNSDDMNAVKAKLGVPDDLASCHTAEIGGYVLEGHVPAASVKRLLAERPSARGLAVPGMPVGSPGMEVGGREDTFDVVLFGESQRAVYGRWRGARPL